MKKNKKKKNHQNRTEHAFIYVGLPQGLFVLGPRCIAPSAPLVVTALLLAYLTIPNSLNPHVLNELIHRFKVP